MPGSKFTTPSSLLSLRGREVLREWTPRPPPHTLPVCVFLILSFLFLLSLRCGFKKDGHNLSEGGSGKQQYLVNEKDEQRTVIETVVEMMLWGLHEALGDLPPPKSQAEKYF